MPGVGHEVLQVAGRHELKALGRRMLGMSTQGYEHLVYLVDIHTFIFCISVLDRPAEHCWSFKDR